MSCKCNPDSISGLPLDLIGAERVPGGCVYYEDTVDPMDVYDQDYYGPDDYGRDDMVSGYDLVGARVTPQRWRAQLLESQRIAFYSY